MSTDSQTFVLKWWRSEKLGERVKGNIPQEKKDHLLFFFVYQSPVKAYGKCFQNA